MAAAAGLAAGFAVVEFDIPDRVLVGADLFFAIYLVLIFGWLRGREGRDLRAHFEDGDEGAVWIATLSVGIVVVSLYAIVATLIGAQAGAGDAAAGDVQLGYLRAILAFAAVPLGWTTLQTVMALHYAGIFYRAADRLDRGEGIEQDSPDAPLGSGDGTGPRDRGGLDFSGDWPEPGPWEFLYYSFTMGMTAQTSDTAVTSTEMRRVTLVHAILSYFYNAVIVALAVNAGLSLGQ